jgi:GNAT superfamily N-acetyltransferase
MATHSQKKVIRYLLTRGQKDSYTENIIWYELITKSMNPNIIIRDYADGDEQGIVNLMSITYENVKLWKGTAYWLWKFKDNPIGFSHGNVVVAEHKGKIIATYAGWQRQIKVGNKIIKGSLGVDLITHQKYRRQGIFKAMTKRLFSNHAQEGIELTMGFTAYSSRKLTDFRGAALKGHYKYGWFQIDDVMYSVRVLNAGAILKSRFNSNIMQNIMRMPTNLALKLYTRVKKPPIVRGLRINELSNFDKDFNDLWKKASRDWNICVVRTQDILNWRYFNMPVSDYLAYSAYVDDELMGYVILNIDQTGGQKIGNIIDIFTQRNRTDIVHNLISHSVSIFMRENVDKVSCWMLNGHPYSNVLKKCGFLRRHPEVMLSARFNGETELSKDYIENQQNWLISTGDSDIV